MLLDEHPAELIHHTVGNFNIHPDKAAIGRIHESLSTLQQARDLRTRDAESALRKLSRTFVTMQSQHQETIQSHNTADHASRIVELDTQKFRIAKAASDLEIESERLEQELEGLRHSLNVLESQGIEGSDEARSRRELDDPTILKLKIFRSLGIDAEPDSSGLYGKAVMRNMEKGDVHTVNIGPKFSKFFYANYFWQNL